MALETGALQENDRTVPSGLPQLDTILQGLRLGDNVVWQVERLADYAYFAVPFADQAIRAQRRCTYVRFAPHEPILLPRQGLEILSIDPSPGFDSFSGEVHRLITERGRQAFYVFDNLSALATEWATDELLANFFQVTCPYLFELDTVAYFALTRGQHAYNAVARVRETTQVLIDVYNVKEKSYLHPLKVWDRYSPQMFVPHWVSPEGDWSPVFDSEAAAELSAQARKRPLGVRASSYAPWESVYNRLIQYRQMGGVWVDNSPEVAVLKQELARMLIGSHPDFCQMADQYLTLDDLFAIRERLIGSGQIGGKAAGMLLARAILAQYKGRSNMADVLDDHDSFYIGSDVFFTFLVNNNLFRLRLELASRPRLRAEEFSEVEERFVAGAFPREIVEQFRNMLDYFGQAPIIIRSSSLLEDSFGSAFAGKYRSEFCANQGQPDERLAAFLHAVKLVYASALNPDVLSYRRKRGLAESDEQMAILVQRVSGRPYRHFFFPTLAGVALSRNLYVWTNRIDPQKGLIRLVFGLGTSAVDRVGFDYPRMVPVSNPQIRPEIGLRVAKYSQRHLDLIDLSANRLRTLPLADVIAESPYPDLYLFVSEIRDGNLYEPIGKQIRVRARDLVLTFNNLISRTEFVPLIGEMLEELERVYGHPVDTEFTASVRPDGRLKINLLQCRPMRVAGAATQVQFPEEVQPEQVLFKSNRFIGGGTVERIRYIVYIDPARYAAITTEEVIKSLGRVVGQINARLRDAEGALGKEMLMGPGRFGSSNVNLGVNVTYADIDNAAVLVEMAREEAGHAPEVSYGTHFFQDLVEAQTIYVAMVPDDQAAEYRRDFFDGSPNCLGELVPEASPFADWVRVIDVCAATGGQYACVAADPHSQRAVCFLRP
jgi:hypothetical protein